MGEASLLWNKEGIEWEWRSAQEALEGESTRDTAKQ